MKKKLIIAIVAVLIVAGIGVGAFFIIKHIADENHKKDIEMAADCAKSFESPRRSDFPERRPAGSMWDLSENDYYEAFREKRAAKRQECSEKYHVTHQEIIDKIGDENYSAR